MSPSALRSAATVALALAMVAALAPAAVGHTTAAVTQGTENPRAVSASTSAATDAVLASGETYWRGWELAFDGSRIVPNNAPPEDRAFQIRRVADGSVGDHLLTFSVGEDGQAAVATKAFDGPVVIQYQGQTVAVRDGVGYVGSLPGGGSVTVDNSRWRVELQTLTASWTDAEVYNGQQTHLQLSSNRDDYVVAVSAAGVSFSQLEQLFRQADYAEDHDADRQRDAIRLRAGAGVSLSMNVSGIDPDGYQFRVKVADTTGSDREALTVKQPGAASFGTFRQVEEAGDVVPMTVDCSECYLVVGSPSTNLLDVVHLRDDSGDGSVTVRLNTRYVGLSQGAPGVPDVAAYTSPEDAVRAYRASEQLPRGIPLSDVRSDLGIDPVTRTSPLAPGTYEVRVATSDDVEDIHPTSGSELRVWDESDARTLFLTEPSVDGLIVSSAPPGPPGALSLGDLTTIQPRDTVALGDRMIVRIDASGVFGHLEAIHGATDEALVDDAEEGVDTSIRLSSGGVSSSNTISIVDSRTSVVADGANDRLYLILDTRQLRSSKPVTAGERYRVAFSLTGISGDEYDVHGGQSDYVGYPYIAPRTSAQASHTVTLAEPGASVNTDGDDLRLPAIRTAEVTGSATVAPGSTLQVRASASGSNPWEKQVDVRVAADGTWRAVLDFTNAQVDQSFTLTVLRDGQTLSTASGRVVPEPTTPTPDASSGSGSGATPAANASQDGAGAQDGESAGGAPGGSSGADGGADGGLPFGLSLSGIRSAAVPVGLSVVGLAVAGSVLRFVVRRLKG